MGTTPLRRLMLATVTGALVATGAPLPAQARSATPSHLPAAITRAVPDPPATAVTPLGVAATAVGAGRRAWPTPVRRAVRSPALDPAATEVVRLANLARATAGCRALRVDARLSTAARLHSQDMAKQNYFSHTSLDGRSPWDRIGAQGYAYGSAENIAAGQRTPASVMDAWLNSPGHKANILNCSNAAIGVGIGHGGDYGIYWTQDFGTR